MVLFEHNMSDTKQQLQLSIIIPCFNCADTVEEAVDSCYQQGFTSEEFEIVMVDDCSVDDTSEVISSLVSTYPNIVTARHEYNQGGGATRNTAVSLAQAEVIFCLDSDDVLPPLTMKKMLSHLQSADCDAVGIHRSIKFIGTDTTNIETVHEFNRVGETIQLEDLLQRDGLCSLYSTFMFTQHAFREFGGYPTEHGFDTQGVAWRFLAAGLEAQTCPDAEYLHRIQHSASYYIREYQDGKVNYNWRSIFIEHIYLFSNEIRNFIFTFDCADFTRNLFGELQVKSGVFMPQDNRKETIDIPKLTVEYVPRNSVKGWFFRIRAKIRNTIKYNRYLKRMILELLFIMQDVVSRVRARKSVRLLWAYVCLRIKTVLKIMFTSLCDAHHEPVDLVVVTVPKDLPVLEQYIKYVKKNIAHTIETIYLVAPPANEDIQEFCRKYELTFIDENSVLGYGVDAIDYRVDGLNRSGWLLQQLLKFAADTFVQNKNYISVCSDTILINPTSYLEEDKYVFFESREWHEPYFETFYRIFGYHAPHPLSLTSHMMMFNVEYMREMKAEMEARHGKTWDQVYIDYCNKKISAGISDYDTYAQWVIYHYKDKTRCKPFYNISQNRSQLEISMTQVAQYKKHFNSMSFHSYN